MKFVPLIWSGVWRKGTRTTFTLLSVTVAFLLFGLLSAVDAGFSYSLERSRLDRLFTDPRLGFQVPMPLAYADQIAHVPGVVVVAPRLAVFGYYRDPKEFILALGVDEHFFSLRPEIAITQDQIQKLMRTRTGVAAGKMLADKYGWKVGDKIPIQSSVERADGGHVWTYDIVAIVDDSDYPGRSDWFVANYDYLDQSRAANRGTVDHILIRINDPGHATQISRKIDALFTSSAVPTRTNSEKSRTQSGLQFLGDARFFTRAVMAAVFFMLLFVTSNTMMQSIRERTAELAALKATGFSDQLVLYLVIAESTLLCGLGALAGLALAPVLPHLLSGFGLFARFPWNALSEGVAIALAVALVSGFIPAWRAKRLRIVDALAGR